MEAIAAISLPMIINGLGLAGWDGHTEKETTDMSTLVMPTRRAAILLHRVTQAVPAP